MAQNNYLAKVEFNRKANDATGIHVLNSVANAFGMFWWFFAILSISATYFTLDLVFSSWTIDPLILSSVLLFLSIIWDVFKYYSIEWVFADQVDSTAHTSKVVATILIVGSMAFHVYGATVRSSNNKTQKISQEVDYQRQIEQKKLELQQQLLNNNRELTPVLSNGTSKDDAGTVATMNLSLKLIDKLQRDTTKKMSSEELMSLYSQNIDTQSKGIMYAQIIAEAFLLFSLLSKFIYKANRDKDMQDLSEMYDALQEMLHLSRGNMTQQFVTDTLEQIQSQYTREQQGGAKIGRDYFKNKIAEAKQMLDTERIPATQKVETEPKRIGTVKPSFARREQVKEEEIETEEIIEAEMVEVDGKKYRCLDYRNYNDDEIYLIKVLWDNGDVLPGEFLTKTEPILQSNEYRKRIGKLYHVLSVLRGKLAEKDYIKNSSRGYIANSALPKQLWQESEEG